MLEQTVTIVANERDTDQYFRLVQRALAAHPARPEITFSNLHDAADKRLGLRFGQGDHALP